MVNDGQNRDAPEGAEEGVGTERLIEESRRRRRMAIQSSPLAQYVSKGRPRGRQREDDP